MAQQKKEKPMGKRLKDIRADRGLSLDYLANETGFSIDYISGIEKGAIM
ncbi:MAG: helix-turn-helix transcriptional regulator, partial [Proteobacteria bacterium]|nr:helix-turn-helix transcriptional regulator [Pseudomonadota bacterium]